MTVSTTLEPEPHMIYKYVKIHIVLTSVRVTTVSTTLKPEPHMTYKYVKIHIVLTFVSVMTVSTMLRQVLNLHVTSHQQLEREELANQISKGGVNKIVNLVK